ncbi:hypothetical protein AOLI_G00062340 [Acnodon oligacanthus]
MSITLLPVQISSSMFQRAIFPAVWLPNPAHIAATASLTEKDNLIPALLSLMAIASSASMMMSGQKMAAKALMRTDEPQTSLFSSVRGKKASQAVGQTSAFVRLTAV